MVATTLGGSAAPAGRSPATSRRVVRIRGRGISLLAGVDVWDKT
jgi:hypothetical protein